MKDSIWLLVICTFVYMIAVGTCAMAAVLAIDGHILHACLLMVIPFTVATFENYGRYMTYMETLKAVSKR